uniref:ERCC1-like central domain-containing protein n=1 Tax=Callorhinchus milii TaxID=7868 RepID=A0A4W3GJB6_CALMI
LSLVFKSLHCPSAPLPPPPPHPLPPLDELRPPAATPLQNFGLSLPQSLRLAPAFPIFRSRLKTFLFECGYTTVKRSALREGRCCVCLCVRRGNPVLRFIRNVAWEFGDIVPDYELGPTTCALFLSLRYHNLKPDYIHQRLQTIGHSY